MKVINYMGSNGTGKSTRTKVMVDYLEKNFNFEPFYFQVTRKGFNEKLEEIGILFENGWLVLGKHVKGGEGWVSLDAAFLSKWEQRLDFVNQMSKLEEVSTIFMEGYFNNRSAQGGPEKFRENGAEVIHNLVSTYDNIHQFIERTNGRTGKIRGTEWAEQSPGWKDNETIKKCERIYHEQATEADKVHNIHFESPREILVTTYFDENFVYEEPISTPNLEDDWG